MLKDMKSHKHLKPGQNGTKRLVEQYGDSLLCVRYRDDDPVKLIVAYTEKGLRDRLKAAGGRWDPQEKLWLIRYGAVRGTELEERILTG